ncbi:hypothetical protein GQ600_17826 [Phytophthora cactorum]|nr:hypothetical protein GQ600_17826 [Phytophthora cactorum]
MLPGRSTLDTRPSVGIVFAPRSSTLSGIGASAPNLDSLVLLPKFCSSSRCRDTRPSISRGYLHPPIVLPKFRRWTLKNRGAMGGLMHLLSTRITRHSHPATPNFFCSPLSVKLESLLVVRFR